MSPLKLAQRAQLAGVDVLAITDHDTVAGLTDLQTRLGTESTALSHRPITLLPGVELSSQWRAIEVHIVGLNIQLDSGELQDALARQQQTRHKRAGIIAERLQKKGFPDLLPVAIEAAGSGTVGRPHFARALVAIDAVKNTEQAFRKYLGAGKLGDVKKMWPDIEEAIGWVRIAGGTPTLAHPDKYRLTRSRLKALVSDYKAAGGLAIEVVSGHQPADKTKNLSALCQQNNLLASCGSDFHKPGLHWAEVGKHSALPHQCRPVWDSW